jgi:hypothetical protein
MQLAIFSLSVMVAPFLFKVFLVSVYTLALLIPVQDRFERRQDRDPDVGAPGFRDELGRVEQEEPGKSTPSRS